MLTILAYGAEGLHFSAFIIKVQILTTEYQHVCILRSKAASLIHNIISLHMVEWVLCMHKLITGTFGKHNIRILDTEADN